MKRRLAFIDYFCSHYRRPLFEEIARRVEADFYFYWTDAMPVEQSNSAGETANFRRIEAPRVWMEPGFMPTYFVDLAGGASTLSSRASAGGWSCRRCT